MTARPVFEGRIRRLAAYLHAAAADRLNALIPELIQDEPARAWPMIIKEISDGSDLLLSRRLRFADVNWLPILLTEILIEQEYHFEIDEPQPLIIDAGCNFGLSTYYFKRIYTNCRIISVEPNPFLAEMYRLNVERNGYQDVDFREAALTDGSSQAILWTSAAEDPASSIFYDRAPRDAQPIAVKGLALGELLSEPVALLKLDVEGAELGALESARDRLHLVSRIVCECHATEHRNPLGRVLTLLEEAGMHTFVARAIWDEEKPRFRLGRTILNRRSYLVYGLRRGATPRRLSS